MRPLDLALAVLVATVWGGNFVVAKAGLTEVPPLLFMTVRFVLVALCLLPFTAWPRGQILPLALYGLVMGGVHFSLMFTALVTIDAATASILSQLCVPFATLLAMLVFKDRPGWRRLSGMAIAFGGVFIIIGEPRFEGGLGPALMVIGAAFAWGLGAVQAKAIGDIDAFTLNGYMALFAVPPLAVLSLVFEADHIQALASASHIGWGSILYQSFAVVIFGYGIWYRLLRQNPISLIMPFMLLVPLIGVIAAVLFLDEAMTAQLAVGGTLTVLGVAIIILRRPDTAEQTAR